MYKNALLLLVPILGLLAIPAHPSQAALATGFSISPPLLTMSQPTSFAFTPAGTLLLLTSKGGQLIGADVSADGSIALRQQPVLLDLSAHTCTEAERGMLGVAPDPSFESNGFVYVYYTYDRNVTGPERCGQRRHDEPATSDTPVNRVSRFTLGPSGVFDPASERVLIDNSPSVAGVHNAGDLHFGKDGYLYISVGDSGCYYLGGGCYADNRATRDLNAMLGKVLRIIPNPDLTPDQRIPPGNPFAASGVACATAGVGPVGVPCKEVFAYGLRNPFRMTFDPNTIEPATSFYINDVGENLWEEVDRGEVGADYRWNTCEGFSYTNSTSPCGPPAGNQRDPIYAYNHDTGCDAITGGAIAPAGLWPEPYQGLYYYADFTCGAIRTFSLGNPSVSQGFADGLGDPIQISFGPGPNGTQALYVVTFLGGTLRRITPDAPGNRAPMAALTADPQFGSATVTFDGSGSSDPDGDALTYLWDFGNGVTRQTSAPTTTYTYPAGGKFTASLVVRDAQGALSNKAAIPIDTLDKPPVVTLILPAQGVTFGVDDPITLQASAVDPEDGAMSASSFSWTVLKHHRAGLPGAHVHPFFGPQTGNGMTFIAPPPEDLDAATNSYLEVVLTVTDSQGAYTVVRRNLMPATVPVTISTKPAGLHVTVNGVPIPDGSTITSWRGYTLAIVAFPVRAADGTWLAASGWDDGTVGAGRTVVTPATAQSYTALFDQPAMQDFLPLVAQP